MIRDISIFSSNSTKIPCLFFLAVVANFCLKAEDDLEARKVATKKTFDEQVAPFVKKFCADCHGTRRMKGGFTFQAALKAPGEASSNRVWKKAIANVKTHDMPPDDADELPTEEERNMFADWVENAKYLSSKDPGPSVIRRLTKVEYGNTLRDLFGVEPAVADELPDEVFGEGYLNTLSPLQMEQYLVIANDVLNQILAPAGKPPTEIQKRLFGNPPLSDQNARESAKKVAQSLARKAYRRPPSESEIDVLLNVYDLATKNDLEYPAALRLMLKATLVSPQFLYITPVKIPETDTKIIPLDDYQLASRLSYLLWATMPDAELDQLAKKGKLHEPKILREQVRRLLLDPRSRALFDGFGAQWLGLDDLHRKTFDPEKFPQMTPALRSAMVDEARLFFDHLIRENKRVVTLVDANYTFLNRDLAKIYGIEKNIAGPEMRRVALADANRGGILGMPGILATTSFPNRTSAVNRGVWVLEQVLGEHVPPAPPNVPTLEKQKPDQIAEMTLRQRTELHRENAVCANCHKLLDPIGFGLENFDAIGRWRDADDSGRAINAAGELPGGKHFSSPQELKALIAKREHDLARNLTERILSYALCRQLEGYDEIVVDHLMKTISEDGYRMQTLMTEIVTSYLFTHRRVEHFKPTPTKK